MLWKDVLRKLNVLSTGKPTSFNTGEELCANVFKYSDLMAFKILINGYLQIITDYIPSNYKPYSHDFYEIRFYVDWTF